LEKLLVETDSPYLVPAPYRGKIKRNEPVYVKEVAYRLADLKNVSFEHLAEATKQNFESLFHIAI
jgi:TatD DNase family protein